MQSLRTLLAVTSTAIAFAVSLVLLAQVIGWASPWLALLLMFYFLGLAKIAEPLFVLRMPAGLMRARRWERSGTIYRRLWVDRFGALLRNTPLRYLNAGVYLLSGARDLPRLLRLAGAAEAAHFWAALLFVPYLGYLFIVGKVRLGICFVLVQLLFNIYPILHLRSLRWRLDAFSRRRQRWHSRAPGRDG